MPREFSRAEKIDIMIYGDVETNGSGDNWFLKSLLRSGCKGYEEMASAELDECFNEAHAQFTEDELTEILLRATT